MLAMILMAFACKQEVPRSIVKDSVKVSMPSVSNKSVNLKFGHTLYSCYEFAASVHHKQWRDLNWVRAHNDTLLQSYFPMGLKVAPFNGKYSIASDSVKVLGFEKNIYDIESVVLKRLNDSTIIFSFFYNPEMCIDANSGFYMHVSGANDGLFFINCANYRFGGDLFTSFEEITSISYLYKDFTRKSSVYLNRLTLGYEIQETVVQDSCIRGRLSYYLDNKLKLDSTTKVNQINKIFNKATGETMMHIDWITMNFQGHNTLINRSSRYWLKKSSRSYKCP